MKEPKTRNNYKESLCFSCKNAYALKCRWIEDKIKVWDEGTTRVSPNQGSPCDLYTVKKCKNYIKDKKEPVERKGKGKGKGKGRGKAREL